MFQKICFIRKGKNVYTLMEDRQSSLQYNHHQPNYYPFEVKSEQYAAISIRGKVHNFFVGVWGHCGETDVVFVHNLRLVGHRRENWCLRKHEVKQFSLDDIYNMVNPKYPMLETFVLHSVIIPLSVLGKYIEVDHNRYIGKNAKVSALPPLPSEFCRSVVQLNGRRLRLYRNVTCGDSCCTHDRLQLLAIECGADCHLGDKCMNNAISTTSRRSTDLVEITSSSDCAEESYSAFWGICMPSYSWW